MPASRARRLCPDAHWLPRTSPIIASARGRTSPSSDALGVPVEPMSLDEAYLDLSEVSDPIATCQSGPQDPRGAGLEASVGIGPNKLVAKVASDAEKPRGFVVLTRAQAVERFKCERVRLMPGIGPKTARRLRGDGVENDRPAPAVHHSGLDRALRREPRPRPPRARALPLRLAGFDERIAKSRSVETTFDDDVTDSGASRRSSPGSPSGSPKQLQDRDMRAARSGSRSAPTTSPPTPACEAIERVHERCRDDRNDGAGAAAREPAGPPGAPAGRAGGGLRGAGAAGESRGRARLLSPSEPARPAPARCRPGAPSPRCARSGR